MAVRGWIVAHARVRQCLLALTIGLLFAVGVAHPAAAAKPGPYKARVFKGPPGSQSGFYAISDDGTAVGQSLLADGSSHSIILSRHPTGNTLSGSQSALVAINVKDEAAGTLFGAAGTNPLFLSSTQQPTTLPVAGVANAIALGPLVSVTATGADGLQHVFIWNPSTGSVRDLGPGIGRGISVDGVVVGRTLAGEAAYWSADGALHVLGFPGFLIRVNLFGQVVGFTTQSGGPTPVMLNLSQPNIVTPLKLPRGWAFGSAKGLADNGLIVGTAYRNPNGGLPSEGIVWASPNKPLSVQRLVSGHARKGVQFSDASGVNDNGLIVGAVTPKRHARATASQGQAVEEAVEAMPSPFGPPRIHHGRGFSKGREVNELAVALDTYTNGQAPTGDIEHALRVASGHAFSAAVSGKKDKNQLCMDLSRVSEAFRSFEFTNASFDGDALLQFKLDGLGAVGEIEQELGCR